MKIKFNSDKALDIVKKFRKMGCVTQAFFKVATGGSTGLIFNCHPDTCVTLTVNPLAEKFHDGQLVSVERCGMMPPARSGRADRSSDPSLRTTGKN
ncbi:MAG: hypothetical protein MUD12_06245 [Spirochaetes bacterium]|jgi:hypothetical protein|nr:hypothetical protein [Spirochaetota bacterium]